MGESSRLTYIKSFQKLFSHASWHEIKQHINIQSNPANVSPLGACPCAHHWCNGMRFTTFCASGPQSMARPPSLPHQPPAPAAPGNSSEMQINIVVGGAQQSGVWQVLQVILKGAQDWHPSHCPWAGNRSKYLLQWKTELGRLHSAVLYSYWVNCRQRAGLLSCFISEKSNSWF